MEMVFWSKRVYEEYLLEVLFIHGLQESNHYSMYLYRGLKENALVCELTWQAT